MFSVKVNIMKTWELETIEWNLNRAFIIHKKVLKVLFAGSPTDYFNHFTFINSLGSIAEELSLQMMRHSYWRAFHVGLRGHIIYPLLQEGVQYGI